MILHGNARGGAGDLARRLIREDENDHVCVHEVQQDREQFIERRESARKAYLQRQNQAEDQSRNRLRGQSDERENVSAYMLTWQRNLSRYEWKTDSQSENKSEIIVAILTDSVIY